MPAADTLWRGSSISVIIAATSARRPVARHQGLARLIGVRRGADEPDHFVDIAHRNREPDQHMGAVARLAEQMLGAPGDHLLAERDEGRAAGP